MDERVRQGMHQIYSELFTILLCLAAVSVAVKGLILEYPMREMAFEYVVLLGTPVYLAVRRKKLKLYCPVPENGTRKLLAKTLAAGGTLMVLGIAAGVLREGAGGSVGEILAGAVSFMAAFAGVSYAAFRIQRRRSLREEEEDGE